MERREQTVPWASFCIPTYRRPDRLAATLKAIAAQTFADFEVVVADNDPEGSSESVVRDFDDARFRYRRNERNVGMIANFNFALSQARGKFVVMMADDDPPYPHMLATLHALTEQFPGYGAYHGACDVVIEDDEYSRGRALPVGTHSHLARLPQGTVRAFSATESPHRLLAGEVFPVVVWSTGVVLREIAFEIGGEPDYGLAHLADVVYLTRAWSNSGCVTVNLVLGCEVAHGKSFTAEELPDLSIALDGAYDHIADTLSGRPDWEQIRRLLGRFLGLWAVNLGIAWRRHLRSIGAERSRLQAHDARMRALLARPYIRGMTARYWRRAHLGFLVRPYATVKRLLSTVRARRDRRPNPILGA